MGGLSSFGLINAKLEKLPFSKLFHLKMKHIVLREWVI